MTTSPRTIAHYELLERLGSGGMGSVWRAYDVNSGDIVALKVLHPHIAGDPEGVKRFQREAAIAASMQSPHIVNVLDWGNDGDEHYLAMEYVQGPTLADKIRVAGQLPFDEVVSIASGIAQALDAAHAQGAVHRDVKPENVILAPDGSPRVLDFGVAWALGHATMTMTGMYVGTPSYMAPDLTGRRRVDIRADIYSLGVVMYEMLTGRVPFSGGTPIDVIRRHESQPPPPIETIRNETPAWLAAIIHRCLSKSPDDRFQSPAYLLRALEQRENFSSSSGRGGNLQVSNRPLWLAAAGIAAAAVAIVVIAGGVFLLRDAGGTDQGNTVAPKQEPLLTTAPVPSPEPALASQAELPPAIATQEDAEASIVPDGLPDRTDCNAIKGTPYRSGAEYSWFWTNCSGVGGPPPVAAVTTRSTGTPVPSTAPASASAAPRPAPAAPSGGVVQIPAPVAPAPQPANTAPSTIIGPPSGAFALPPAAGAFSINTATRATFDDNASLKSLFMSNTGVALSGDGVLRLNGISGWSTYMGYNTNFRPGEGLLLFFAYDSVTQANLMLQTMSTVAQFNTDGYRRFGVSIPKASPRIDLWQGKQATGGNPSLWKGGWTPQAGRWYGLLLGVTPGGQFQAYLWDRNNPSSVLEYSEPVGDTWKATEWRFLAQANNGLLVIDDLARVTMR